MCKVFRLELLKTRTLTEFSELKQAHLSPSSCSSEYTYIIKLMSCSCHFVYMHMQIYFKLRIEGEMDLMPLCSLYMHDT